MLFLSSKPFLSDLFLFPLLPFFLISFKEEVLFTLVKSWLAPLRQDLIRASRIFWDMHVVFGKTWFKDQESFADRIEDFFLWWHITMAKWDRTNLPLSEGRKILSITKSKLDRLFCVSGLRTDLWASFRTGVVLKCPVSIYYFILIETCCRMVGVFFVMICFSGLDISHFLVSSVLRFNTPDDVFLVFRGNCWVISTTAFAKSPVANRMMTISSLTQRSTLITAPSTDFRPL